MALTDEAIEKIKQMIISGRVRPGDPPADVLFGELRSRSSEDRRYVAPRRVDPDYPYRGQRY